MNPLKRRIWYGEKVWYDKIHEYKHTLTHTQTHNIMKYYPATKRSEIMPLAATWMDLEIITLSEVNQTERDKSHMISLICGI